MTDIQPSYNDYVLNRLQYAARGMLPAALLDEVQYLDPYIDPWAGSIVYTLKMGILAEPLGLHETYGYAEMDYYVPASWWQHWKQAHQGKWYTRWLKPARMERKSKKASVVVKYDAHVTFPDLTATYPSKSFGQTIRVVQPRPVVAGDFSWEG